MRMSFDVDDERAFRRTRDELCERFGAWAERQGVAGEPGDVELLLDWKVNHGDGQLDRWSPADVEEFLLGWYARKVSAPPDMWADTPSSVAAYVDFLAHEGLLAPGSSATAVRRHVEEVTPRFLRSMDDSWTPPAADEMLEQLSRTTGISPDELLDVLADDEPQVVGPVRRPSEEEVAAAVAGSRTLGQVRALAAACAAPGLDSAEGNLGLADALRLVADLDTGDVTDAATSAADLPRLDDLVEIALRAGAVRWRTGRLVAVARFADLPDVEAYGQVARAAFEVGLCDDDEITLAVLAQLLDAGDAGTPADAFGQVPEELGPLDPLTSALFVDDTATALEGMIDLGMVERRPDGMVATTAAGRAVGSEILVEAGMEVVWRADPETADAASLLDTLLMLDEDDAAADLTAWWAAHPAGAAELVTAVVDEDLPTGAVLSLLELAATVLGPPVEKAALDHRGGPHGALVTMWLLTRGALDPASVDPAQMLNGTIEIAAAMLDEEGPDGVVEFFDTDPEQTGEILDHLWRAGHERTADVLDALGRHHPDKKIAKAARKSLMKLRNR